MKKLQQRSKLNNGGFSLVELIIVVAIMAVLIGVLAPQYLRYVEKTRLQKDNSGLSEIANAIEIAMADETISSATASGTKVTITNSANNDATITFGTSDLETELKNTVGATFTTSSNAYNASGTAIEFEITKDATTGTVAIKATGWIENVGDSPATKNF